MFKRNPGKFNCKLTLLRPNAMERDELGGLKSNGFTEAGIVWAACEKKSQSRQMVMGDFVTLDTRYFVTRDLSVLYPHLSTQWQISYKGYRWEINQVELIDESRPYYMQITATAINAGGRII